MKSKKDKTNEALSIFCGALVVGVIVMIIIMSTIINLAIDSAERTADNESRRIIHDMRNK